MRFSASAAFAAVVTAILLAACGDDASLPSDATPTDDAVVALDAPMVTIDASPQAVDGRAIDGAVVTPSDAASIDAHAAADASVSIDAAATTDATRAADAHATPDATRIADANTTPDALVSACATNHGGCDELTTCTDTALGRSCSACPDGFSGTGISGCVAVNNCPEIPAVSGFVHDASGAPVAGLTVYASSSSGHNAAITANDGSFSFALPSWIVDMQLCVVDGGAWWSIMQTGNSVAANAPDLIECIDQIAWTCGNDLDITLPNAAPITVNVTQNGTAAAGARVNLNASLLSDAFEVVPGDVTQVGFIAAYTGRTTDQNGAASVLFYPSTGSTFDATASLVVDGVTLTKTVSNISTAATSVAIALPNNPELISGSIVDTMGRAVPGLAVYASNSDGSNSQISDSNGEFSFFAPAGTVDVALCVTDGGAWWSIMQGPPNFVNAEIPDLVVCLDPVSWSAANGPLNFTMPSASPITVNVVDGNGQPVSGARVSNDADLHSNPFDLVAGDSRTVEFMPGYSGRTTDASGAVTFEFYPSTDTTFDVTATNVVDGVTLTSTVSGIATTVASVDVTLPSTLQSIAGSILDSNGSPVPGLTVYASNTIGHNSAVTDDNGDFAFSAPPGAVDVAICVTDGGAWWSIMQGPPNFVDAAIPDLVECIDPVSWQSTDGDLNFTVPVAFPIHVNVIDGNGQPVVGAQVSMSTTITSDSFDLLAGVSRTVDFIPGYSGRTSDANGEVSFEFYPSTDTTFDVSGSATIDGVSLVGNLLDASANATATFTLTIPGTTDLAPN